MAGCAASVCVSAVIRSPGAASIGTGQTRHQDETSASLSMPPTGSGASSLPVPQTAGSSSCTRVGEVRWGSGPARSTRAASTRSARSGDAGHLLEKQPRRPRSGRSDGEECHHRGADREVSEVPQLFDSLKWIEPASLRKSAAPVSAPRDRDPAGGLRLAPPR